MVEHDLIYAIFKRLEMFILILLEEVNCHIFLEIKTQGKRTFMCTGAKLWNRLPLNITVIESSYNSRTSEKVFLPQRKH